MKRHDESISDRLRRMAATDELSVGRGRAEQISSRALARALTRPQARRRTFAAAIAGSAFAIVSVTGIGAVADQAVPGDSLYAIDRAYESVGRAIGRESDRTQETLIEALALAQRGDRDRAYLHVTTELGGLNPETPYGLDLPEPAVEDVASAVVDPAAATPPSSQATAAAIAAESAEVAPGTTSTTAPVPDTVTETTGDPFILAIENALRANQVAVDAPDEESALAATEAVRSVVKLAVGATETLTGQQAQAAPTLSSTTTTLPTSSTTTKPKNGANGPGTTTTSTSVVTNSSTTTTVPIDSGNTSSGTGDTAGGNSGGSQQGSGSAGGTGSGSEPTQPPIILPIP